LVLAAVDLVLAAVYRCPAVTCRVLAAQAALYL
jgi:hypothetical protein